MRLNANILLYFKLWLSNILFKKNKIKQNHLIMDDRTVDLIFAGSLESLPPVSSKIVRIFTSSTFTGNVLMQRIEIIKCI